MRGLVLVCGILTVVSCSQPQPAKRVGAVVHPWTSPEIPRPSSAPAFVPPLQPSFQAGIAPAQSGPRPETRVSNASAFLGQWAAKQNTERAVEFRNDGTVHFSEPMIRSAQGSYQLSYDGTFVVQSGRALIDLSASKDAITDLNRMFEDQAEAMRNPADGVGFTPDSFDNVEHDRQAAIQMAAKPFKATATLDDRNGDLIFVTKDGEFRMTRI